MARVRITGGDWRSRLIQVADMPGLRPTPDRVRETLFNWLGHDLTKLHCLDLFAGSGILGFEAASRGAAHVTLVEHQPQICTMIKKNLVALDGHSCSLLCTDALKFASVPAQQRYDILFLDPPFRQNWFPKLVNFLPQLLEPGARIYAEAEMPLEVLGTWRTCKRGRAGQVYFHLLEHDE